MSIYVLTLSRDVLINLVSSSEKVNFLRETLKAGQCFLGGFFVGWRVVHCPADTLILPHYAFQAQKFLPCLFSLDILVRMCSSLALKNLTELCPKSRNLFIFLSDFFHWFQVLSTCPHKYVRSMPLLLGPKDFR